MKRLAHMGSVDMELKWIGLFTDDLEAMQRFYENALGIEVTDKGEHFVEFTTSSVKFAICTHEMLGQAIGEHHARAQSVGMSQCLAFACRSQAEVDSIFERATRMEGVPVQEGQMLPWNVYAAFLSDPDGNLLELFTQEANATKSEGTLDMKKDDQK